MKRLLLTSAFFLISFIIKTFAQDLCGTPAITNIENVKKLSSPQRVVANSTYTLRIYFHVIRGSSGTGGVSTSNVLSAYSRLNRDFNSHGIYFNWDGIIDPIDNDTYYNNSPDTCIFSVNNHTNGIDIYLFPPSPNYQFSGKAHGVGMNSEYLVVGNYNNIPTCMTSTISHEMGHVLNLWHTHHGTVTEGNPSNPGYDTYQCKELVNGSNSSTCGDYVEDTPADPNLKGKVNGNCVYTGYETDANNQTYDPDVDLIMSYAPKSCRTRFSTKQGERMRESIANLSYLIQTQCQFSISGSPIVCNAETFTIQNLPSGATVVWSTNNSNISIVSGQGTSTATFQKVANGACLITAQVSGGGVLAQNLTKIVWVGSPTAPSISGWPSNNQLLPSTSYQLSATGNPDAQILEYQWNVVSGATIISGGNTSNVTFMTNPSGSVKIGVRARNSCGWGSYNYKVGTITNAPINSPGNNIVNIPLPEEGEYEIMLWNTNRLIRTVKTSQSSYDVDLNGLPSDLYIIKVMKDGQSIYQLKVKK